MNFSQHSVSKQWRTEAVFRDRTICVLVDPIYKPSEREALVHAALAKTKLAWPDIERNLVKSLHHVYNEAWSDPEEDMPRLRRAEFLQRLSLRTFGSPRVSRRPVGLSQTKAI